MLKGYTVFDPIKTPLDGMNLVEASAGTGKTYAIAGLFLRLLLEKNLSVHQILVVTYTEAATEELRDRIRRKIREAVEAFSRGSSEDVFLGNLVRRHAFPDKALRPLREALRTFDEAAIFTIHGFCRRMLQENAFESGSLFDTELIADPSAMVQECVDDFWRSHLYTSSPLFVNFALEKGFSPEGLLSLMNSKRNQPFLRIVPEVEAPETSAMETTFKSVFSRAREAWLASKSDVTRLLTCYEGLHKGQYPASKVHVWLKNMDDFFIHGENSSRLFPNFRKFSCSELGKTGSLKKGFAPPEHPFFGLCEDLCKASQDLEEAFAQRLLALKVEMFREVDEQLSKRKIDRNVQTFDDLLVKMYFALEGKGGRDFGSAIRRKYRAALIDEFQDTDPVQYAIFQSVFGKGGNTLFLVGDPKQSIYGFRGADVFAYMAAADKVRSHYTMAENWRSEPDLINAINALFSNADHPFVYENLAFNPVSAAKEKEEECFTIEGRRVPPFKVWFVDPEKWGVQDGAVSKGLAQEKLPDLVAGEITRLLNLGTEGKALIGGRPLRANDIAVLVRQNAQALLMQKSLSGRGVPSVLFSTENLFDSREARETERFLAAVVEPNNESLLKSALSSSMFGLSGEELERLTRNEALWETRVVKFRGYHDLWQERGFIRMFRSFLKGEKVLLRLIAFTDGERRNTNLLHLMEVLHQVSVDRNLSMTGLLKWLSEQRDQKALRSEEHQLRLESDENAVNLVTIHKSKGLEYPIVFCPFCWEGVRSKKTLEPLVFHNPQERMQLIMDVGSEEQTSHRAEAEREEIAENLRLLYVALTRAKSGAYMVWGRFNGAETSAPAYLLHPPKNEQGVNLAEALAENFASLKTKDLLAGAKALTKNRGAAVEVIEGEGGRQDRFHPSPEEPQLHVPEPFVGRIDRHWKIASFSSLVSSRFHSEEEADYDALAERGPEDTLHRQEEESGLFNFPKGAKAGSFFHDVLEHLDFQDPFMFSRQDMVARKLSEYGYAPSWRDHICDMVDKVLKVPLGLEGQDLSLDRIRNDDRLNELEFYFPVRALSPETVAKILGKGERGRQVPETIGRLYFSPVRGFMKGFMDMVFRYGGRYYLVDWKSNVLGAGPEDYGPEGLTRAMEENFYVLQYMLYTLALNRYLRLRAPEFDYGKHFGGVLYVFLRGVDPARGPQYGIYRDKPPQDVIQRLSEELMGPG